MTEQVWSAVAMARDHSASRLSRTRDRTVWRAVAVATGLGIVAGAGASCSGDSDLDAARDVTGPVTRVELREGTALYFDLTPDGAAVVVDLAGQLWDVPVGGGRARALTDAVRDTAEDRQPSVSPDGRWIATRSDRPGGRGIWLHERGADRHRRLTDSALVLGGDDGVPVWLPDGEGLIHHHRGTIVETSVASGVHRTLVFDSLENRLLDEPFVSADGRRLLVSGPWPSGSARALLEGPPGAGIWEIELESGRARRLTDDGVFARAPAYDPDGRRVAYFVGDGASFQLHVREPDGSTRVLSSEAGIEPRRVRWSPDGRDLYFVTDGRLRSVSATGGPSREVPLVAELAVPRPPAYARSSPAIPAPGERRPARGYGGIALAPDGERVALLALGRLWIVDLNGQVRAAADVPISAAGLHWSPNGERVLWSDGVHGEDDLWVTEVASGESRRITRMPGIEEPVGWSPSGDWIAFVHEGRIWILPSNGDAEMNPRDVGSVRWTEIGAFGAPYRWLARGDTLLTYGMEEWPVASRACAGAELIAVDGAVVPLREFPCRPGHAVPAADGSLISVERGLLTRHSRTEGGWETGRPLTEMPALNPSTAADGSVLFVGPDGLHVIAPDGSERTLGWPVAFEVPEVPPLLIRNARIVLLEGDTDLANDVLIVDGRIREIGAAGTLQVPPGGTTLDASGGWLMPGLIDTHLHFVDTDVDVPREALQQGITTIRDMWGRLGVAAAFRDAVDAGVLPGARIVVSGPPFYPSPTSVPVTTDFLWLASDADEMERGLELLAGFGAGHVKMRYVQSWQGGAELVRRAHARGLPVSGHCAHGLQVLLAGIDGLEHADGQCGDWEFGIHDDLVHLLGTVGVAVAPIIDVHLAPTLEAPDLSAAQRATLEARAARAQRHARMLHDGGVRIVAGSDAQDRPGGLHAELERLVGAGLSTRAALEAATLEAAEAVNLGGEIGQVRSGYVGDLLLLDADPLEDIRNTRRIHTVIQGGRIVSGP
jgi:imidazolonepropionase-like amidohydrolase/Tol biopolymer transport system component